MGLHAHARQRSEWYQPDRDEIIGQVRAGLGKMTSNRAKQAS